MHAYQPQMLLTSRPLGKVTVIGGSDERLKKGKSQLKWWRKCQDWAYVTSANTAFFTAMMRSKQSAN